MSSADQDRQVIQALRQAGADLTQPRHVRHYIYLPNERMATIAGPRFEQLGFAVETRQAAEGARWLVLLSKTTVVTEEEIASLREAFEAFAKKVGGEYDGWEAAATP